MDIKQWRPKGWENPHRKEREPDGWSGYDSDPAPLPLELVVEYDKKEFIAYEAGADAMLEALRDVKSGYVVKHIIFGDKEGDNG